MVIHLHMLFVAIQNITSVQSFNSLRMYTAYAPLQRISGPIWMICFRATGRHLHPNALRFCLCLAFRRIAGQYEILGALRPTFHVMHWLFCMQGSYYRLGPCRRDPWKEYILRLWMGFASLLYPQQSVASYSAIPCCRRARGCFLGAAWMPDPSFEVLEWVPACSHSLSRDLHCSLALMATLEEGHMSTILVYRLLQFFSGKSRFPSTILIHSAGMSSCQQSRPNGCNFLSPSDSWTFLLRWSFLSRRYEAWRQRVSVF
jgi:hypothetical protein